MLGILRDPRYAGYSVYTNRLDREKNKRGQWYAQIMRDEDGDPVMGQWMPIVEPDAWWMVQERLNEPRHITNRSGSAAHKHVGSSLNLCGVCEKPVRAHSKRYWCEGRLMRYLADVIPTGNEPRLTAIAAQIGVHEDKLKRAQYGYDEELIEGYDLKRIREREKTAIAALQAERRSLTATTDLVGVLEAKEPVKAFDAADLVIKRRVIDFLVEVRLYPHPRGRKTFDQGTVQVTPKAKA